MEVTNCPVDVLSVCSANGDIRPLRVRMEDDAHRLIRIHIDEVISMRPVQYVGVEAQIFLCRACVAGKTTLFELRYMIRSHCWSILRKVY